LATVFRVKIDEINFWLIAHLHKDEAGMNPDFSSPLSSLLGGFTSRDFIDQIAYADYKM